MAPWSGAPGTNAPWAVPQPLRRVIPNSSSFAETLLHDRALPDPWRLALILGLAFALAVTTVLSPSPVLGGAAGQKVAIIVGPVGGGSIQSNYLNRGEQIAQSVEARGGTAVRVFSPNATWANVLAAVNGANIIVYIGHGSGFPNPYSGHAADRPGTTAGA